MLSIKLKPIFKARGIDKPYSFLVKAGLSPNTATTILNNNRRAIKLDHIETLCIKLNCTPNDLLQWVPDNNSMLNANHPMHALKTKKTNVNLKQKMQSLTLNQLNEVMDLIEKTTSTENT